ncbi:Protein kinase [Gracilaria domingensis]|nr:Protein kinase [Gracilaria domingensis]
MLNKLNQDVDALQRDLDMLGFFTMSNLAAKQRSALAVHNIHDVQHSLAAMHHQLKAMATDVKLISQQDRSRSTKRGVDIDTPVFNTLLSEELAEKVVAETRHPQVLLNTVLETRQKLQVQLPKILRNNFSEAEKTVVLDKFEAICGRWRLHPDQISVSSSQTVGHDWNHDTYNGTVTLRDLHQNIIRTAHVFVKYVTVGHHSATKPLAFLKELVVLRELKHPCLSEFYGAAWPDDCFTRSKAMDARPGRAMIVTERMTHNIPSVIRQRIMKSEAKRVLVLRDVASAVAYLHSRGLFDLDLNPANVLLRIVKGEILGSAKLNCLCLSKSVTQLSEPYGGQGYQLAVVGEPAASEKSFKTSLSQSESTSEGHTSNVRATANDAFRYGVLLCFMLSSTHTPFGRSNHIEEMLSPSSDIPRSLPLSFWTRGIKNTFLRALANLCFSEDESCRPSFHFIYTSLVKYINKEELPELDRGESSKALHMNGKNSLYGRNGWTKDANLAKIFFEHAASMGHIPSTLQLGRFYFRGKGGHYDLERGIQYFTEAANAGSTRAQYYLGECYYNGNGVKRNIPLAIEMYRRAASQGHLSAQQKLGHHLGHSYLHRSQLSLGRTDVERSRASQAHYDSFGDLGGMMLQPQVLQPERKAVVGRQFGFGELGSTGVPGMTGSGFKSLAGGGSIAMNALNGLEQFYTNL